MPGGRHVLSVVGIPIPPRERRCPPAELHDRLQDVGLAFCC